MSPHALRPLLQPGGPPGCSFNARHAAAPGPWNRPYLPGLLYPKPTGLAASPLLDLVQCHLLRDTSPGQPTNMTRASRRPGRRSLSRVLTFSSALTTGILTSLSLCVCAARRAVLSKSRCLKQAPCAAGVCKSCSVSDSGDDGTEARVQGAVGAFRSRTPGPDQQPHPSP